MKRGFTLAEVGFSVGCSDSETRNFAGSVEGDKISERNLKPVQERKSRIIRYKWAFTLAEVLITLGIIGIVAALTIPTIYANIQHKIATSRLKTFYSTMKQMLLLSIEDNGDVNMWDITLPYDKFLDKYFMPYLKGTRTVSGSKNKIYFLDGSSISLFRGACMDIHYDYNSYSPPNKLGYDKFIFLICSKNDKNTLCTDVGFCTYRYNSEKNNRAKMLERCKQNGAFCSGLLEYDHWEFLSDYPYK